MAARAAASNSEITCGDEPSCVEPSSGSAKSSTFLGGFACGFGSGAGCRSGSGSSRARRRLRAPRPAAARIRAPARPALASSADSRPCGSSASTASIAACSTPRIDDDAPARGDRLDPRREFAVRGRDHREHRGRDRMIVLEQPVQNLLDAEGELAQVGQSHHPSAALQRVELAAHGAQRLAIARIAVERMPLLVDRLEHLAAPRRDRCRRAPRRDRSRRCRAAAASPPRSRERAPPRRSRRSPRRRPRVAPAPPASSSFSATSACRMRPSSPISSASSRRLASFARSDSRIATSAGACRISSTSCGSALRSSLTAASTESLRSSAASFGASPRRFASSGAIRRSRSGRCCSTASM